MIIFSEFHDGYIDNILNHMSSRLVWFNYYL